MFQNRQTCFFTSANKLYQLIVILKNISTKSPNMKLKFLLFIYILMGFTAYGQIVSNPTATTNNICVGANLNLTATPTGGTAPYTYAWTGPNGFVSSSQNPTITSVTLLAEGIYSLVTTDSLGIFSISENTLPVIVNPLIPEFDALNPSLCKGGLPPFLSPLSSNGITGTWIPAIVNNTTLGSSIYTFTPDAGQCATAQFPVSITVVNNQTPIFNFLRVFCFGSTPPVLPALSVNGISGVWSPNAINNTATGTYKFTPNVGQCAVETSIEVVIKPLLTPTFNLPSFVCFNRTAPLLPTSSTNVPPITGTWNPLVVSNTVTQTYSFTPNVALGLCSSNYSITISVNPNIVPVTPFSYTSPVCQTQVATNYSPNLSTGFTPGGVFTSTPSGLIINASTGVIDLSSPPGTYSVNYKITAGADNCFTNDSSSPAVIVIKPLIITNTNFSYNTPICKNAGTAVIVPGAGFTIGGVFSSTPIGLVLNTTTGAIDLNASNPGTYTVNYAIEANGNNCFSANANSPVQITINPSTNSVTSFSYASPVCLNAANPSPILATGFTIGSTFSATPTGLEINANTGVINLALSTPGTYTINVAYLNNIINCINANNSSATITIIQSVNAITTFTYSTPVCKNVGTLSPNLTAPGFTLGGTFSSTTGLIINPTTGVINLATSTSGTYIVNYNVNLTTTSCLVGNSPFTVNITEPTVTTFNPIVTSLCKNELIVPILPLTSSNGISGTWSPAEVITTTAGNTDYIFTPSSSFCATSQKIMITVLPEIISEIKPECINTNLTLLLSGTTTQFAATNTYTWKDETGAIIVNSNGTTLNVSEYIANTPRNEQIPFTYTVQIKTLDGCTTTNSFTIDNLYCDIQKGISPNNDGNNEFFDLSNFDVKEFSVYNRYGTKVYVKSGYKNEWTGLTDSGEVLPDGTYFYNIQFANNDTKTGWVYINKEIK